MTNRDMLMKNMKQLLLKLTKANSHQEREDSLCGALDLLANIQPAPFLWSLWLKLETTSA